MINLGRDRDPFIISNDFVVYDIYYQTKYIFDGKNHRN